MQAISVTQFGDPDVLHVQSLNDLNPGPAEVVIKIKAAGVNPVDTYIRAGAYAKLPDLPYTPGIDGAGIVDLVGSEVTAFKVGDRVYCSGSQTGTYAEKAICTINQVHPLPDHISFAQGAALGIPYATAYYALYNKANVQAGQTVLIHGATGSVGLAAVQLAKALDLTVFATAGSPQGAELLHHQGTNAVFDHLNPQHGQDILAATQDSGVNLILEMLANINLALDLELLAPGGHVIVIGNRGSIEINPRLLMLKNSTITGLLLTHATAAERDNIHIGIGQGLTNNTLAPVIHKTYPLDQAAQAHRDVIESPHCGRIVLTP